LGGASGNLALHGRDLHAQRIPPNFPSLQKTAKAAIVMNTTAESRAAKAAIDASSILVSQFVSDRSSLTVNLRRTEVPHKVGHVRKDSAITGLTITEKSASS